VLFIDRTHSGKVSFNKDFARLDSVKLAPVNGKIKLHIFIDESILEVFANDGEQTLCEGVYPTRDDAGVETYSKDGEAAFSVQAWALKSIWR
jgi:fructan beta-fructosidase